MGTLLTAGAALLPDADHPSGTISHVLGPVSHHLCRFISWASGGHRHGTHSLLFVVAAVAATWAGEHYLGRPFTLGLVFFLLALAVRSLHLCPPGKSVRTYGTVIVLATAGTFAVDHWIVDRPVWLPICVGLGCLAHLLGDCLTDRGCRLLWPFPLRTRVPLIERTGNRVETWVISPVRARHDGRALVRDHTPAVITGTAGLPPSRARSAQPTPQSSGATIFIDAHIAVSVCSL